LLINTTQIEEPFLYHINVIIDNQYKICLRKKAIHTYKQNPQRPSDCCGLSLKMFTYKTLILQRQLNDIINISRDGVEVEGDAITSLCEVDTLVGAKDGGRLDFVVASRDEEAGVHTV